MSKYDTKRITSIGGSALIEGIMMRGPKRTTVAVRTGEEEIYTEDLTFKSLAERFKIFKVPFIRGIGGLIDSMRLSYKALMLSAEKAIDSIPEDEQEQPSKLEKWIDEKLGDKFMKILMVLAFSFFRLICLIYRQTLFPFFRATESLQYSGNRFLRAF